MMRLLILAGIVILVAGAFGYGTLRSFNHFGAVERQFAGQCTPVNGLAGPEDLQIDEARNRVFISSLDRRADNARGAIHLFDLDDPLSDSGWRDRTGGVPAAFRPLGLYFYEDADVQHLFVVNEANNAVELFNIDDNGDLEHLETFAERRLTSPNDVAAVGPRSFYVTNDVKTGRNSVIAPLLYLLRSGAGSVFYTDGTTWRLADEDLRFANGVNVSPDGATLYVAETSGSAIRVYDRDQRTGRIVLAKSIDINGGPDNINIDSAGVLWIGALPKPLLTPRFGRDASALAPSQIVRIGPSESEAFVVYRDNGEEISAATSAARAGSKLLIGSLFEKKFLICNLPPQQD